VDSKKCLLGGRDCKNRTPLSFAVKQRHAGDVAALLEARADPAATVGEPIKDRMCRYFEQGKCRADSCQFAHCASELGAPRYAAKDSRTALTLAYVKHDGSTKSFDVIHLLVKAFGHPRAKKQHELMLHEHGEDLHADLRNGFEAISPAPSILTRRPAPIAPWARLLDGDGVNGDVDDDTALRIAMEESKSQVKTPEMAVSDDVSSTSASTLGLTSPTYGGALSDSSLLTPNSGPRDSVDCADADLDGAEEEEEEDEGWTLPGEAEIQACFDAADGVNHGVVGDFVQAKVDGEADDGGAVLVAEIQERFDAADGESAAAPPQPQNSDLRFLLNPQAAEFVPQQPCQQQMPVIEPQQIVGAYAIHGFVACVLACHALAMCSQPLQPLPHQVDIPMPSTSACQALVPGPTAASEQASNGRKRLQNKRLTTS